MSRLTAPNGGEEGFSLLEVIVAFAILAGAIGVVLPAISEGSRGIVTSTVTARSIMQARSKIDQIGGDIPLAAGRLEGTFDDDTGWSIDVRPMVAGRTAESLQDGAAILYQVQVEVTPRTGRTVRLTTLRLAP